MGAPDLIFELRSRGYSIRADGGFLDISPADNLPLALVKQIRQSKPAILSELRQEARRQEAIAILQASPQSQRGICADTDSDPHNVILTVAVRNYQQTCELLIPKDMYDPWRLLELIERLGQTTH